MHSLPSVFSPLPVTYIYTSDAIKGSIFPNLRKNKSEEEKSGSTFYIDASCSDVSGENGWIIPVINETATQHTEKEDDWKPWSCISYWSQRCVGNNAGLPFQEIHMKRGVGAGGNTANRWHTEEVDRRLKALEMYCFIDLRAVPITKLAFLFIGKFLLKREAENNTNVHGWWIRASSYWSLASGTVSVRLQ